MEASPRARRAARSPAGGNQRGHVLGSLNAWAPPDADAGTFAVLTTEMARWAAGPRTGSGSTPAEQQPPMRIHA